MLSQTDADIWPGCEGDDLNYVLIFAGGHGVRMNSSAVPKQFIEVNGKSIIIHTLELFDGMDEIDGIQVVCLADWIDELRRQIADHGIRKVMSIVPGGETGQMSIYNGLVSMRDAGLDQNSLVMIHDGVRPLVSRETIRRNLEVATEFGNAITVSPCTETVILASGDGTQVLDRNMCQMARAPQTFRLGEIITHYEMCIANGQTSCIDSATIVTSHGCALHTVEGNPENIKITTPMDVCLFRGLLNNTADE